MHHQINRNLSGKKYVRKSLGNKKIIYFPKTYFFHDEILKDARSQLVIKIPKRKMFMILSFLLQLRYAS